MSERRTERPQKWNVGQFRTNFQVITGAGPNQATLIVAVIAQIRDRAGDSANAAGRSDASKVRHIDIGGVVFDWGWDPVDFPVLVSAAGTFEYEMQSILCVDRLDSTGNPSALSTDWGASTLPSALASSFGVATDIQTFPSRILYRFSDNFTNEISSQAAASNANFASAQNMFRCRRSRSLRLKLRLGWDDCLVLHSFCKNGPNMAGAGAANVKAWCRGTVYWRFIEGR